MLLRDMFATTSAVLAAVRTVEAKVCDSDSSSKAHQQDISPPARRSPPRAAADEAPLFTVASPPTGGVRL
jgi:hypothetical protein